MMLLKKRKYKEIITRLDKDFQSNHKQELIQKISTINQDFIDRGLYNTSHRIGQLIRIHYDYINKLLDSIFESLETDYTNLSPVKCKSHLLIIVENEYARLLQQVPAWLLESGFRNDTERKSFEQNIQNELMRAKQNIENKCALWEERWKQRRKWYHDPKWIIGIIIAVLLGTFSWFVPEWISRSKLKVLPVDPNTGRTPMYYRTRERVEKRSEYLIKEKIDQWLFISTGKMKITRHDGSTFAPGEAVYSGSVVNVFWEGIIQPFLEEDIQEVFDEVGAECRNNDVDASIPLEEAADLLRGMVWRVYNRMADVDQKLRTKRSKEKPSRRNVQSKCDSMIEFIDGQLEAAKALYSRNTSRQE